MDYTNISISSLIDSIKQINPNSILYLGDDNEFINTINENGFNIIKTSIQKDFDGNLKKFLPENHPEKFDLIIALNTIEYLYEQDSINLLQELCNYSDSIIVSLKNDLDDNKIITLKPLESWSNIFFKYNFIRDISFSNDYKNIYMYKKTNISNISLIKLIEDYERNFRVLNYKLNDLNHSLEENKKNIYKYKYYKSLSTTLKNKLSSVNAKNRKLIDANNQLMSSNSYFSSSYTAISNSRWWKITKPGRMITASLRKIPGIGSLVIALRIIKKDGVSAFLEKIKYRKQLSKIIKNNSIIISHFLPAKMAVKQLNTKFDKDITFSILVPLFNTPIDFLKEMIDSCICQTYQKWELCLADASTDPNGDVYKTCQAYMKKDSRIKYKKIDNISISDNTNEAIKMATGNYISLLDHDDFLHPSALYENMLAITHKNADFIFTDEMTFGNNIFDGLIVHLKADYAPDTLRTNNYICHFSTFSRELLDKVGYFNPECNGSQDFDIILRLTEQAKSIVHIPKVLYFWRCHPGSVASDISVKPYCLTAGLTALENHLERVGIKGTPELIPNAPGLYKINYELLDTPLVSIIIINDNFSLLAGCINSVISNTTYENYEIIVVNLTNTSNKDYYDIIKNQYDNIQFIDWEQKYNYSSICNYATTFAKGSYYLFLDNDTEVISPKWIEEMLMFCQRDDVAIVGAKLYYEDETVQHAGIYTDFKNNIKYYHKNSNRDFIGYMGRLAYAHNVTAVTKACMLIKKSTFDDLGKFDENYTNYFSDIDLCLKAREKGYLNVFTPFSELYHYENKLDNNYNNIRDDEALFQKNWFNVLSKPDPYYNPNFKTSSEDFSIDVKPYTESQY